MLAMATNLPPDDLRNSLREFSDGQLKVIRELFLQISQCRWQGNVNEKNIKENLAVSFKLTEQLNVANEFDDLLEDITRLFEQRGYS